MVEAVEAKLVLGNPDLLDRESADILVAATATWWWNRSRTFVARSSGRSLPGEWLHWMALMGFGAVVNYAVYAGCLLLMPAWRRWPVR